MKTESIIKEYLPFLKSLKNSVKNTYSKGEIKSYLNLADRCRQVTSNKSLSTDAKLNKLVDLSFEALAFLERLTNILFILGNNKRILESKISIITKEFYKNPKFIAKKKKDQTAIFQVEFGDFVDAKEDIRRRIDIIYRVYDFNKELVSSLRTAISALKVKHHE